MTHTIDWAALATELTSLNQAIEQATERRDQILDTIRQCLPAGTKTAAGDYTISLSKAPERLDLKAVQAKYAPTQYPMLYKPTLNADAVTTKYPPTEYPELYEPRINKQLVEAEFSPAALRRENLYTTSNPRVSVK